MPANSILDRVSIASPCPASWADMKGDDRVRFCKTCDKHVYNLSAMPAAEATALVVASEGSLCVKLYRRKDGTVLTSDCPVGLADRARRRLFRLASFAVVGLAAVLCGASRVTARIGASAATAPTISLQDWYDWVVARLGFGPVPATRGEMILGGIRPRSLPTPASSTISAENY